MSDRIETGQRQRRKFSQATRVIMAAAGIALLGACVTQRDGTPSESYEAGTAGHVFTSGLHDIRDIYIDDVKPGAVALAGLNGLEQLDSEVTVERRGTQLALAVGSEKATFFDVPKDNDLSGWGALTAVVLDASRTRSEAIAEATSEELYEVVFDRMTESLDDFSRYATRAEARDNRASRDGFGGLGIRIRLEEDGVHVVNVMENTPAEATGLKDNDVITHIDGVSVVPMDQREVVDRLRGPVGSTVSITIAREENPPFDLEVTRAHVVPQTVSFKREGSLGYIRLSGFNQHTTRRLKDKVTAAMRETDRPLSGLIIDLRNNPGGLLDQAVSVSDLFVKSGRIVSTHGRHPDSHQFFSAEPADVAEDLPIVVLINGNSASAAEIVAAALQDSRRAVVVGSNSFGKGSVQTVLRLPNGGELTLTWARFHAPTGYALAGRGVQPDVCTSHDDMSAEAVISALESAPAPKPRRHVSPVDQPPLAAEVLEEIIARCPKTDTTEERDREIAERLLLNRRLYSQALGRKATDYVDLPMEQAFVDLH